MNDDDDLVVIRVNGVRNTVESIVDEQRRPRQCYPFCECAKCTALRRRASLRTRGLCLTCGFTAVERGKMNCRQCLDVKRARYNDVLRNQVDHVVARIQRSAETRHLTMKLRRDRIETLITSRRCYYCNSWRDGEGNANTLTKCTTPSPSPSLLGLDRVDNLEAYVDGNVVACCAECNYAKGVRSQRSFIANSLAVAHKHRFTVSPHNQVSLEAPF